MKYMLTALLFTVPALADWPVYMGNLQRTGQTDEPVSVSSAPAWVYQGPKPSPGFYTPIRQDTLGPQSLRAETVTFDFSYTPVIAEGRVYFGSSTEEALYCLDAASGRILWSYYTEGAIRLAPTVYRGRVYFGADDGRVVCLDAASGNPVWQFDAAPEPRLIIANGRMASQWPVRTSVTVADDTVYFSAGLFPANGGVFLYALHADTGELIWENAIQLPAQGYIYVENDILLAPNGRASPAEYHRADGTPLVDKSDLRRQGGSSFIGSAGGMLVYGPTEYGILRFRVSREEPEERDYQRGLNRAMHGQITGIQGRRILEHDGTYYFLRFDELVALSAEGLNKTLMESALNWNQRTKKRVIAAKSGVQQTTDKQAEEELPASTRWKTDAPGGRSLIRAGRQIIVGAEEKIYVFDATSGAPVAAPDIDGTAWELAADNGRLFAATDTGRIYCFGPETAAAKPAVHPNPFEDDKQAAFANRAKAALEQADTQKGFCLVLGAGEGRLAYEIARQSDMQVVCAETDPDTARRARENLTHAGMYGSRVVIRVHKDGVLPYASHVANLIVSDGGAEAFSEKEAHRCLQPYGGVMITDRKPFRRGPLVGAGDWTHMFADAANTSSSGDTHVRGTTYRLQWFGNAGFNPNVGWHANGMGPLYKDGRMYLIKYDNVEVLDAYNGASLWNKQIPGSFRLSPGREGGSACVDADRLYLAVKNDCRVYDAATGEEQTAYYGPDSEGDWGFIAVDDRYLYGSKQHIEATVQDTHDRVKGLWYMTEPEFAVSTSLFALDKKNGIPAWTYGADDRVIVNSTVTIADGRVFFVESRRPEVVSDPDGSVLLRDVTANNAYLVALDAENGKIQYEKPFNFKAHAMLYLSYWNGRLIASGSHHVGPLADVEPSDKATSAMAAGLAGDRKALQKQLKETFIRYVFQCIDAATGATQWEAGYTGDRNIGGQHNYNVTHPVVMDDIVYSIPTDSYLAEIDMQTGTVTEKKTIHRGKGCSMPTASEYSMFFRSLAVGGYDFESGQPFYISQVSRPSCWMSILPAGGVVQMPEYSIGCNCAFPLQTSIVMAPVE